MSRGLGIDAVEIDRIRRSRRRLGRRFEARILTDSELAQLDESRTPDLYLAGRFAAKEAVMKVLGTGWAEGVGFRQIEILRDSRGVPVVHLTGVAEERARALGIRRTPVSITHTKDLAMAVALGE